MDTELINTATVQAMEDQYTTGVYTKRPITIVRGQGAHLWDADGKEYIDCVGGQGQPTWDTPIRLWHRRSRNRPAG